MNKKILGLIVLLVIIAAVVGGIFWWNKTHPIEGSADDYVIDGQIVTNEKAGLNFEMPDGWEVEKIDELEGSVMTYSPDTKFIEANAMPLETGCLIEIGTVYKKMDFEELEEEIDDIHYGLGVKSDEFEIVTTNNQQALKNTFDTVFMGKGTVVYVPYRNKFYSFAAYAGPDDEEQCLKDFDNFLNKVSYK